MVGGLGQGVDLELGSIALHEALVEVLDGGLGLLNALRGEAEVGSDGASDIVSDTDVDIDGGSDDSLGALLGDSLDIHTTLGGGDDHGATSGAVQEDSEVEFTAGELALANVDRVTDTATGASLLGDELLTDHLASEHLGLGRTEKYPSVSLRALSQFVVYSRVDDADTTLQTVLEGTLTTATGKNLGLDDQIITTC